MSEVPLYKAAVLVATNVSLSTRWTACLPSKVNYPSAINVKALRSTKLVTQHPRANETFVVHRVTSFYCSPEGAPAACKV